MRLNGACLKKFLTKCTIITLTDSQKNLKFGALQIITSIGLSLVPRLFKRNVRFFEGVQPRFGRRQIYNRECFAGNFKLCSALKKNL